MYDKKNDFRAKKNREEVIIEIKAGTGGEEASLFVLILSKMYKKFAQRMFWNIKTLSTSNSSYGIKEIKIAFQGHSIYKILKNESGIHRIQRVPPTESKGRIHTSIAYVIVFKKITHEDNQITKNNIRIDSYRGSGSGGQHINTTDSAIRVIHIPTNTIVVQGAKSQHQNKSNCLKILKNRLECLNIKKTREKIRDIKNNQRGNSIRSNKIRTYNYHKNQIIDHRTNFKSYNLYNIVNEGKIENIIKTLFKK